MGGGGSIGPGTGFASDLVLTPHSPSAPNTVQHIELIPIDQALSIALHIDDGSSSPHRSAIRSDILRSRILDLPGTDLPWGGFVAICSDKGDLVGSCGFKGAPTPDHSIEIAYFTFPLFEGHGYGTAMARALVALAWSNPALLSVCAHTTPRASASTRILTKLGMRHVGEVVDPVEGRVWRWLLERPDPVN